VLRITEPRLVLSQKIVAKKEGCGPPEGSSIMPVPGSRQNNFSIKFSWDMYFFNLFEQSVVVYSLYFIAKVYYESVLW